MPIYSMDPENPYLQMHENLQSSSVRMLGHRQDPFSNWFSSELFSPTQSIGRLATDAADIAKAEGTYWDDQDAIFNGDFQAEQAEAQQRLGRLMHPEEANKMYAHLGFSYDEPVYANIAARDAIRKQRELQIEDVTDRSTGVVNNALGFGGMLAGTIVDPVNIALTFVPAVRAVQVGRIAAALGGRYNVAKALVGAGEGMALNAIAELPVMLDQLQSQGLYGAEDYMLNVALGGLFGSGARLLGGKIGPGKAYDDIAMRGWQTLKDLPVAEQHGLIRMAMAQDLSGKDVQIETVLRKLSNVENIVSDAAQTKPKIVRLGNIEVEGRPFEVIPGTRGEVRPQARLAENAEPLKVDTDVPAIQNADLRTRQQLTDAEGQPVGKTSELMDEKVERPATRAEVEEADRRAVSEGFDGEEKAKRVAEILREDGYDAINYGNRVVSLVDHRPSEAARPVKLNREAQKRIVRDAYDGRPADEIPEGFDEPPRPSNKMYVKDMTPDERFEFELETARRSGIAVDEMEVPTIIKQEQAIEAANAFMGCRLNA